MSQISKIELILFIPWQIEYVQAQTTEVWQQPITEIEGVRESGMALQGVPTLHFGACFGS